jgi:hypothetical protein
MATNIVSLVMQFLTPDMIARIASALGLDRSNTQRAIAAAVPSLLAALAGTAAKPGGARKIFDAVTDEDPGILANLGKMLDGGKHKNLVERGSGFLSSVLGGSTESELARAVGKFAGLGEGISNTLLSMLGPIVLGSLRRQQANSGLDASGLANLLTSQKDNIADALPSGFASLLDGTGVLENVRDYATATARSAATPVYRADKPASSTNWLAWAIPLIALLALAGWYLLSQRSPQTEQQATVTTQPAPETVGLVVDGVDIGTSVTSTIDSVKTTLEGITDSTTAQTALPKLEEASGDLEEVSGVVVKLSAEQKTALAGQINVARPLLDPLFDKVLAIPGVADIAKPAIDGLKAKFDALAKA